MSSRRLLSVLVLTLSFAALRAQEPADPLRELQEASIADHDVERPRVYAFGHHGRSGVFSTHRTHSNRPVLALAFGAHGDLHALTGPASVYRDREALARLYGTTPPRTVDPLQVHIDQTELHRVLLAATDAGARRIVVIVMDGGDWQTYAAASVVRYGTWDPEGPGAGLAFFEFVPPSAGSERALRSYASVVTSPLRSRVPAGFDIARGGRFPWSQQDLVYLAGQYRRVRGPNGREIQQYDRSTVHAVADSASTATALFSGRKTLNGRINVGADGEPFVPLGRTLQARGFSVAIVTDVPFDHATPAAVYANAESRGHYEQLGRQMLGLGRFAGADVVLGYGHGHGRTSYLAADDLARVAAEGRYRVVTPVEGADGGERLLAAAREVAAARAADERQGARLFGFFGTEELEHAPFRTADGRYDPTPSLTYGSGEPEPAEHYDAELLARLPDLQEMTQAATTVLDAVPERPFLLVVEAGLVDWALHGNNLDHAVGEVLSAEATFRMLTEWITGHGWWEETLLLVTSDHGHLLDVDLEALRALVHD